ncbi:MAG: thioredoxin TrxC [Dokdonella sp.]|uniref:thioredoxin TrxC n=1 Tax=Dokdonella sp. TaxID=2291710 RepID=UPI003263291F
MNAMPILIPCPSCGAMNRAAVDRVAESPTCGRCHVALFQAKPIVLTTGEFDRHALRSGVPLLVDFWAPWCGPCVGMAKHFAAAARQLEPRMRLAKVDTDAEPALGTRFAIRSIPTLIVFANGREVARQSGAMGTDDIVRWAMSQLPGG